MLSTIAWVPRGYAKERPIKYGDEANMHIESDDEMEDAAATSRAVAASTAAGSRLASTMQGYEQEDDGIAG